jgi:adenylate kinase family enzyme
MKKLSIIILSLVVSIGAMAQTSSKKIEVLYFKANLSCCQARACQNLENITKEIITNNFPANEVVFKTVALTDEVNKKLVDTYNAKSQTLIILNNKKKKFVNLSASLAKYARDNDKASYEKDLLSNIKALK